MISGLPTLGHADVRKNGEPRQGLGSAETLRTWYRRAEVDAETGPGMINDESAERRKLRLEVLGLRRAYDSSGVGVAFG